jgi:hypothetical protein
MVRLISTTLIVALVAGSVTAPAFAEEKHAPKGASKSAGGKGGKGGLDLSHLGNKGASKSTATDLGLAIGGSLLNALSK